MRKEVPYHELPKAPGKVRVKRRLVFKFRDGRSVEVSKLADAAGGVHVCVRAPMGRCRESVLRFSVSAEAARVLGVMLLRGAAEEVSRGGAEGAEREEA